MLPAAAGGIDRRILREALSLRRGNLSPSWCGDTLWPLVFATNLFAPMRRRSGETFMTVLIIGGTGFIGRRLIPLLAQRGEESVVMDINPQTANFSELAKVKVLRGDISQFDDVMAVMTAVKTERVVNLAYYISSDLPPRVAFFFKAEDGIRYHCVTGVQTCALPI